MKPALVAIGIQLVMWFLAWHMIQSRGQSEPHDVLKDIAFSFFFWWLVVPILGCWLLNEWVTEIVKLRRARVADAKKKALRSGQDNGLYD